MTSKSDDALHSWPRSCQPLQSHFCQRPPITFLCYNLLFHLVSSRSRFIIDSSLLSVYLSISCNFQLPIILQTLIAPAGKRSRIVGMYNKGYFAVLLLRMVLLYSWIPEVSYLIERGHQSIKRHSAKWKNLLVSSLYQVTYFWNL